ncbi:DUF3883 domain-containing protein [Cohnella faecalis]|uniref:DUF3883 domain-containing protein n=1 Tax=Cohnella faecalis TaxID=2315694 RepID=A0A398CKW2_9BACL|nr:DUF3883 domain-containing protein [Cohnella faecalis]RIE01528.1 DUF3883 domain-containing protein [Cohnella faecalis]
MSKSYLVEVSKWLYLFNNWSRDSEIPLSYSEAIYLRRKIKTDERLAPEKVLDELIEMDIIERRIDGRFEILTLSILAHKWIEEISGEGNFQLQKSHKHHIAKHYIKKWIIRPEIAGIFSLFVNEKNGQFFLEEHLFSDSLTFFKIKLLSFEVIYLKEGAYFLDSDFNFLIDGSRVNNVTTEKILLEQLELQHEIGLEGELWVVEYEKARIKKDHLGKGSQVERVSEQNVSLGYDVYSLVEPFEDERCIEVKTSRSPDISFYLTPNELTVAKMYGERYWIYLLVGKKKNMDPSKVYRIKNPARFFEDYDIKLHPSLYKVQLDVHQVSDYLDDLN